jgi:hypothetical protein
MMFICQRGTTQSHQTERKPRPKALITQSSAGESQEDSVRDGSMASVGEDVTVWIGSGRRGPSSPFLEKGKGEWEAGLVRVGQGERGCDWDIK